VAATLAALGLAPAHIAVCHCPALDSLVQKIPERFAPGVRATGVRL